MRYRKLTTLAAMLSVCAGFCMSQKALADSIDTANLDDRISELKHKDQTSYVKRQIAALKAKKINLNSKNLKDDPKPKQEDKTQDDKKPEVKQEVKQGANVEQPQTTTNAVQTNPPVDANPPKQTQVVQKPAQDGTAAGLDLNQTSGTVNVSALANYLAERKGTFSAGQWANIIMRESRGSVTATNASSGAYGVLQLLGHGEHPGMTLGEQIDMAMPLPASAWAETAY